MEFFGLDNDTLIIIFWLSLVTLLILARHTIIQIIRVLIGSFAFFFGSKAKYSFKIFKIFKPRLIEVDTFDELQEATSRTLVRSHLHDFIDNIDTGDIFTFVGHIDRSYQVAIKWYTASPVSHVGICYKKDDQLFFVEAASSGFKISDLHETLHRYYLKFPVVIYRKLVHTRDEEFYTKFDKFIDQYKDRKYTPMDSVSGLSELMRSAIDIRLPFIKKDLFKNKRDTDTLFCSELVAEAYHSLGLFTLDQQVPSNEFTPGDFSRINEEYSFGPERRKVANLSHGAYLGDEIYVLTKESRAELEEIYGDDIKGPKEDVEKPKMLFTND